MTGMAKKLDDRISVYRRRKSIAVVEGAPLVSLKDLRKSAKQTQEDLAIALSVGQDAISRIEKRSDMLLSTLRQYVESVGGKLALVATFPDQPPVIIDSLGEKKKKAKAKTKKHRRNRDAASLGEP